MLSVHMILWFFGFSMFGYFLECMVLTYETKKPVLDRGFVHGPFCIIYGFGATGAYFLLYPVSSNPILLFLCSMIMATILEMITATVMIRIFGSFWWDYSKKPFNYKGIICLESSVAWGFLGIVFFRFLDGFMHQMVGRIPNSWQARLAAFLVIYYIADFLYTALKERRDPPDDSDELVGRLKVL